MLKPEAEFLVAVLIPVLRELEPVLVNSGLNFKSGTEVLNKST